MDNILKVLNSYLSVLGVPPDIDTVEDRKRVQKAVYLAQAAGANLGYDYNWYVKGPYSPDLANDYYKLSEALLVNDIPPPGAETTNAQNTPKLKDSTRQKLKSLAKIINTPDGVKLSQEDWLELASSLHYLQAVSRYDLAKAREVIDRKKPHLRDYVDLAQAKLKEVNLLP
jgi:uncharacterized protein YwgA